MTKKWISPSPWLGRKVKQGFRGYPIATIAFYGPTTETATKVVVAIFRDDGGDAGPLERWLSEESDIRVDTNVGEEIVSLIKAQEVRSVVVTDGSSAAPTKKASTIPKENHAQDVPVGLAVTAGHLIESNRAFSPSSSETSPTRGYWVITDRCVGPSA
jgi:hypothetical protein